MIRAVLLVGLLAGCATTAPEPVPLATAVLKEAQETEVAVVVHRTPPLELMQPVHIALPADGLHDVCEPGDYGITRAALDSIRAGFIAAGHKLRQWRIWGGHPSNHGETP